MSGGRSNRILTASRKAHAIPTYVPRRVCAAVECCTVLSIYNSAEYCWIHELPTRRTGSMFGR